MKRPKKPELTLKEVKNQFAIWARTERQTLRTMHKTEYVHGMFDELQEAKKAFDFIMSGGKYINKLKGEQEESRIG